MLQRREINIKCRDPVGEIAQLPFNFTHNRGVWRIGAHEQQLFVVTNERVNVGDLFAREFHVCRG